MGTPGLCHQGKVCVLEPTSQWAISTPQQCWGQGTRTHAHACTHIHTAGEAAARAPPLGSKVLVPAGWAGMRWGEGGAGG